jgi:hypothetical protein
MLGKNQQIQLMREVYYAFENGKRPKRLRKPKDSVLTLYNEKKYENYTKVNFLSVLIFTILKFRPTSEMDYVNLLNDFSKRSFLQAMKFKNTFFNRESLLKRDQEFLNQANIKNCEDIFEMYEKNRISYFTFYELCKDKEIKNRIIKKELKLLKVLIEEFLNIDTKEDDE